MSSVLIRIRVVAIALSIAFGSVGGAGSTQHSEKNQNASDAIPSSKRMADGKEWTTANLNVNASPSYCVTTMANRIAVDTVVCIRGSRRSGCASHSETGGADRPMTNGGRWRSAMAESATIRLTKADRRSPPS
jgi:hypothetical protein